MVKYRYRAEKLSDQGGWDVLLSFDEYFSVYYFLVFMYNNLLTFVFLLGEYFLCCLVILAQNVIHPVAQCRNLGVGRGIA
jgi:hypothetical protein